MRNFIDEIEEEMYKGEDFVTLRLNKFYEFLASMEAWETSDIKDKFTRERLLGVETTEGFINKLNQNIKGFVNIGYTTCDPRELQYYTSDDSDETVSFDEYVKLFYNVEGDL